ncbi:unnamed protein product, partial [Symbiodinium natans]
VLLSAARAQTCEDGQTCQEPGNLGEEGSLLQARISEGSEMDTGMENSEDSEEPRRNGSMASYVEKVLGKVTALGGSHQKNVELAKDEVRNLAIQVAADPDYTVFNVSQSNMNDAFERIIAEMEDIINDTLVSLDKDHKEFDIMINNILQCGVNLKASNVSVTEMSPAVLLLGVEHDVCRNDTVILRDQNHTAQTNYYNYMANPNMPDCAQNFGPGTCPAQQDFSVPLYFDSAITCASEAEKWAGAFHKQAVSLKSAHEIAEKAVKDKYEACDTTQLTYEQAFCTYRTELIDQCSALDNCYSSAVSVFKATKDLILKSNSSRHVAYIAARQVQCYIRVLQSDNLTMAAIEACDHTKVDTSPLALTVPTIPPKPACDVSLAAEHPCGTAWVTKNYKDSTKYWVKEEIAHKNCMPCLTESLNLDLMRTRMQAEEFSRDRAACSKCFRGAVQCMATFPQTVGCEIIEAVGEVREVPAGPSERYPKVSIRFQSPDALMRCCALPCKIPANVTCAGLIEVGQWGPTVSSSWPFLEVLLSAARAQMCEDGQTCQVHGNLGEEGSLLQARISEGSEMDTGMENSEDSEEPRRNGSMASYVEKVLGKVTALGGSHQKNVELAKDEVRNLAVQVAADPYTVFNVSQSNMNDAFERIIAEMEDIINDTLVSLDKDHKEFDIMINNILQCGVNLKASNVSVTEMSPAVLLLGVEHDVCRNDTVDLRDKNHTAQTNYYNYMANPNMPDCAQNFGPGTCPAQQDFSVPLYFDNAITCASEAEKWAGAFHKQAVSLKTAHEIAEKAVKDKYEACDTTQLTYEQAFCTYRTELIDQCSALDNCYSSAVSVFKATKDLILKSNSSRHVAYIAARQVQCYIRVLQSDNLTMAAIEACDHTKVDTSPLALTVPTIPPKPACDVSLAAEHPCGAAWVTKNYEDSTKYWVKEQIAHKNCAGLGEVWGFTVYVVVAQV